MLDNYITKYSNTNYSINKKNGIRYYYIADIAIPSVTSILASTRNYHQLSTNNYQSNSMIIGNYMHKYLDHYISKSELPDENNENYTIAKKLAHKLLDNYIIELDEIWGTEITVNYKNNFAGTIDLICFSDNNIKLIDYKSSSRKKTKRELDEFFLQLAAYSMAHDWQFQSNIENIILLICYRNGKYEKIEITKDELEKYKKIWLSRLVLFGE
ncbi:MAG: hypothetical protein CMD65_03125 [Gammaproteobacteria bacterium]|nr:hypothetical protein [Gammaproteobacteria bacterium]|tara:strand:+ start:114 stop:752 length:639 start_codon:yes stop_codon:yes gene_type:complete